MGPKVLARNWLLYGLFALAGLFVGPLACPCSPERVIVAPAVECPEPEPCQPCPPPYCGPHERRTHRELVRGVEC